MNRNAAVAIAIVAVIVLAGLGAGYVRYGQSPPAGAQDPVRIGGPALEHNALIYVAADRGLFEKNGVNVTLREDYPTGVGPVRDMAAGELDLSVTAEYPVLARILSGGNVSIVATIDRYQNEKLIGRRDLGVSGIGDLRGRRIGLPRGTILEFFLGRLLELNGMKTGDVTLVDVDAAHLSDAIASGEVDAIMCFEPYVTAVLARLGENAFVWPGQSGQLMYGVVAARDDWIAGHPGQLDRLLRSLDEAREYSLGHPGETRAIVQARLNQTDAYMAAAWPDHHPTLSLDHSLLTAMTDEARWMIANNLASATAPPDLREQIETAPLARVRPDAVNIL